MATTPRRRAVYYPTRDGRPIAESQAHADLLIGMIQTLQSHYATNPLTYVSGNPLLFYEEGNPRSRVTPDVFLVHGIEKRQRKHYLTWLEGKGPDLVVELTSKTTRSEDVKTKFALYRDVLRVPEYILFDPFEDYLWPPMQGYRLSEGRYDAIGWVAGRLPSEALGLHFERDGAELRLVDPATGLRLPTLKERADQAEAEVAQLRRELDALRGRMGERD